MKKKNKEQITDEDICKAYEALGLQAPETKKDSFEELADLLKKGEDDDELNEDEDEVKENDEDEGVSDKDGDYDEDADEDEDVSKAINLGALERIEKAIAVSYIGNTRNIKALAELIKGQSDEIEDLREIVKAQEDTISSLTSSVERYGSRAARRAHRSIRTATREFAKANDDDNEGEIRKGEQGVSMSRNRSQVAEFSKACMSFESSGVVPSNVIARLKNEFGVNIIQ